MEFNVGDKVQFEGSAGQMIDAEILSKDTNSEGKFFYRVTTDYGVPRMIFIEGQGLIPAENTMTW